MIEETYDQEHWTGISEDDQLGQRGNVLYSQGLDLTSNTGFINCSRLPELETTMTAGTNCQYTLNRDNNSYLGIFFGKDRKVYHTDYVNSVFITDYEVNACFSLKNYFYFICHRGTNNPVKIYRILKEDTSLASWNSTGLVQEVSVTFPAPTEKMYLIQEFSDYVVITLGKKVIRFDDTDGAGTITFDEYKFFTDTIVGITKIESGVKIVQRNGRIVLWNLVNETIDGEYSSGMGDIKVVWQIGGIEYAIIGSSIFYINGMYFEPLITEYYSDVLGKKKSELRLAQWVQNNIVVINKVAYFIGTTPGFPHIKLNDEFPTNTPSIMTYGSKIKGLNPALNHFVYRSSRDKPYFSIYGISSIGSTLYIAFQDADGYGIDKIDLSIGNYQQSTKGIVQYLNLDGKRKLKNKNLVSITSIDKIPLNGGKLIFFKVQDGSISYLTGDEVTSTIEKVSTNEINGEYDIITQGIPFRNLSILVYIDQGNVGITPTKTNGIRHYGLIYRYEGGEKHKQ